MLSPDVSTVEGTNKLALGIHDVKVSTVVHDIFVDAGPGAVTLHIPGRQPRSVVLYRLARVSAGRMTLCIVESPAACRAADTIVMSSGCTFSASGPSSL